MNDANKRHIVLSFIIIAVLNILIYFPSLSHIPRSDQFTYLGNIAHEQDWPSFALKHCAINREKIPFGPSNNLFFRPGTFFILGNERYFFGYHFMSWQAMGIFLHLLVLWRLLKVLWRIYPGPAAAVACLFFSALLVNAESVTWHHIHGYLLSNLFMLIAFYQVIHFHQTGTLYRNRLLKLFLALFAACLFHEIGVVYSLLFGLYFLVSIRKPSPVLAAISPCFIYIVASCTDLFLRGSLFAPAGREILQIPSVFYGLLMAPVALFWWAFVGMFPTLTFTEFAQRTFMYPIFIDIKGYSFEPNFPLLFPVFLALGLIASYAVLLKKHITHSFIKKNMLTWVLLLAMLFSFAFVVCFGRAAVKGFQRIMVENGAYYYFFWILFMILIYMSIPFDRIKNQVRATFRNTVLSALAVLAFFNAYGVFQLNAQRNVQSYPQASLFKNIEQLVKDHGKDHSFSFAVHPRSQIHLVSYKMNSDPAQRPHNAAELLYPQYYRQDQPQYLLHYNKDKRWQIDQLY